MHEDNQEFGLWVFTKTGVVIKGGHFVFTHGDHSDIYVNKQALYKPEHEADFRDICRRITLPFRHHKDLIVAGVVQGGIPLARMCAQYLTGATPICALKNEGGGLYFSSQDIRLMKRRSVLLVEDNTVTGESVRKLQDLVFRTLKTQKGRFDPEPEIAGLCLLCNRGNVSFPGLFTSCLVSQPFASWPAERCSLCEARRPIITDIGHGAEWARSHPNYPTETLAEFFVRTGRMY